MCVYVIPKDRQNEKKKRTGAQIESQINKERETHIEKDTERVRLIERETIIERTTDRQTETDAERHRYLICQCLPAYAFMSVSFNVWFSLSAGC